MKEVIELLAAGGYLEITEGTYPMVGLRTARPRGGAGGLRAYDEARPSREARFDVEPRPRHRIGVVGDDALFDRLRALRKRIADEIGRPPTSCSQTPLCAICARAQARDEEEMLEVSGVGATKLERYGAAFLAEISAFGS